MWSYKVSLRFFLLLLVIGVGGCGFSPLYRKRERGTISPEFSTKVTGNQEDAYIIFKFKQSLENDLLEVSFPEKLRIEVKLKETFGDIAYAANASALRAQGLLIAHLKIYRGSTLLYKSSLDSVTSYTLNVWDEFSNLMAKKAARMRLVVSLAEDVAREVSFAIESKGLKERPDHSSPSP